MVFSPPSLGVLLSYNGRRWKLRNEREGTVEISHSDPAETYTAGCFGALAGEAAEGFLALGCASGRVQAWGPRSGELLAPAAAAFHALARGADCAVSTLAAPSGLQRGASVFAACSGLPEILEVGILDGATRASFRADKVGLSHLAVGGPGAEYLLSVGVGVALKLWALPDIGTGEKQPRARRRLAASGSSPSCIDVADASAGSVLALCCDGALQVDVFSCDGEASKPVLEPEFVLTGQDRIWTARFMRGRAKDAPVLVAGAGHSIVSLWSFAANASARESASKTVTAAFTVSADELGGRVLSARPSICSISGSRLTDDGTDHSRLVIVAYGASSQPAFAEVCAGSGAGKPATIRRLGGQRAQAGAKASAAAPAVAPTVLGPLEAGAAQRRLAKRAAIETQNVPDKRPKLEEPDVQAPEASGALSFAPLVRQGLRAKDAHALDKVFKTRDRRAVDATVAELSGSEAFDLLQECTARLLTKSVNGAMLGAWVKRVFEHHNTFIASQPRLKAALAPLQKALEIRLASRTALVRLRGRLRLIRNLGKEALLAKDVVATEVKDAQAPLVEYVEGHSDAEQEEDEDDDEEKSGDEGEEEEEDSCDVWDDDSDD